MSEETDPKAAKTFPALIRAIAAAYGDDPAVTLKGETLPDAVLSFADLERQSAELARGLMARGVGKGARIGFIAGNGPSFAIYLAAIARIGAVAVPISTLIKANELVRVLRQSDISGLIAQRSLLGNDYAARLCDALPGLRESGPDLRIAATPYLRWIISSGEGLPASIQDVKILTDAAKSVSEDLLRAAEAEVHSEDQAVEIYTSGSMALPKGVKHLHGAVAFRAQYLARAMKIERHADVRAVMPMFWVGGLMMFLMPALTVGAVTVCTEGTAVSSRFAIGSVLTEDDLKAAAPKPPYWGLGMSETLGPYCIGDEVRAEGYPLSTPIDHFAERYEARIADENNQPVGDGEIGEMQVRGYAVSPGLHKIERADYYTPDGYFRTGDMCRVDGKRIHFVGRGGDMIKTAGANVSPAEVEIEMQQLEGVHSAYVVGLPDKERGQLVVAAVVARDGVELDFNAIQAQLKDRLSSYKVPRAYVALTRDEVPMLPSNKVSKRLVETLMAERLGR